jgi:predicted nucleic acid-binding protein
VILADTSIWVDHIRSYDDHLAELIADGRLLMHPHIMGEVALGNLRERDKLLARLELLPQAPLARDGDVRRLIANHKLFSTGIGYVDAHLLASVHLLPGARLWTGDHRLHAHAERLSVAHLA